MIMVRYMRVKKADNIEYLFVFLANVLLFQLLNQTFDEPVTIHKERSSSLILPLGNDSLQFPFKLHSRRGFRGEGKGRWRTSLQTSLPWAAEQPPASWISLPPSGYTLFESAGSNPSKGCGRIEGRNTDAQYQ